MDILMTNKSENNTNHGRARTSTEKRTMLLGSVWFHVVQWSNQTAERRIYVGYYYQPRTSTDRHENTNNAPWFGVVPCSSVVNIKLTICD